MGVGLKEKIAQLVKEADQAKREELGKELLLLCEEIRRLVEENQRITERITRLEQGFLS